MSNPQRHIYQSVNASPVKSFFVSMLTRDIKLAEAILDLLDNCVDGILRSKSEKEGEKPYEGFKAEIDFNSDSFSISDNCGGIPWDLHDYAFRMGRPEKREPDAPGSVGVYGIGMKRAIFKIGRNCLISTRNADHQYEVAISPEWIADEFDWKIPVDNARESMDCDGTTIVVGELNPGISETFGDETKAFQSELVRMVSTHYAYIIDKGFEVIINRITVKPRTVRIAFGNQESLSDETVRPFVYKATSAEGVEVFLAVGFTRPIPNRNEIEDEQEARRYSSEDAGWTILCNDRAVIHCDRSELTGWGEAGVPRYHTQFIAVSGIVELRSKDPGKLPTTTTKRGIDASSQLYLQIKNKMREGMRLFTDYTNKWKGNAEESKNHIEGGRLLSLEELRIEAKNLKFTKTRSLLPGCQSRPKLPLPREMEPTTRRISFVKEIEKIEAVAEYMEKPDSKPAEVGESCFDAVYEEAIR